MTRVCNIIAVLFVILAVLVALLIVNTGAASMAAAPLTGAESLTGGREAGTFAQLGAWLKSETKRDRDGAAYVFDRFGTFISRRLRRGPGTKRVVDRVKAYARGAAAQGDPDGETVAALAAICAPHLPPKKPPAEGRTASRVADVMPALNKILAGKGVPAVRQYLDVGCAEGGLTAAFGQALGLSVEDTHGCDIFEAAAGPGFTFTLARAEDLPYEDRQFQAVSTIMALHHFEKLSESLAEISRVLEPGGVLVVREHDCTDKYRAAFLDLVHYAYAAILGTEIVLRPGHENEDFEAARPHITSSYRTKNEWTEVLEAAGFALDRLQAPNMPRVFGENKRGGGRQPAEDMFYSYYAFYLRLL